MRPGSHAKVIVRPGDLQFVKKYIQNLRVIVLAGMDKDLRMLLTEFVGDRGTLDELWPGTDN